MDLSCGIEFIAIAFKVLSHIFQAVKNARKGVDFVDEPLCILFDILEVVQITIAFSHHDVRDCD
jgi:hypothetical protein